MKKDPNIEKLLKDAFDNHEAEVSEAVWSKIQTGIAASAAAGGAGTVAAIAAKTTISVSKIVLAAAITGTVATGTWYIATSDDADKSVQQPTEKNTIAVQSNNKENTTSTASENKDTYVFNKENHVIQPSPVRNEGAAKDNAVVYGHDAGNTTIPPVNENKSTASASDANAIGAEPVTNTQPSKPLVTSGQATQFAAKINYNPQGGYAPAKVFFSNGGDEAVSVKWDFGDGNQSFASTPSHTFDQAGSYLVKLTAYNNEGLMHTDSVMISFMASNVNFDVAAGQLNNVFSPNGDGINDTFNPLKERIVNASNITVTLFDRVGTVLSKWESEDGSWDGRLPNGQMADPGTYYFTISFLDENGKIRTVKNFFMLTK